ncbi:hypothetical protein HQ560_18860 [bacterium]|nr:hypothetical protein [bacterium]
MGTWGTSDGLFRSDADLKAHRALLREWEAGLDIAPVELPPWVQKMMERANKGK